MGVALHDHGAVAVAKWWWTFGLADAHDLAASVVEQKARCIPTTERCLVEDTSPASTMRSAEEATDQR